MYSLHYEALMKTVSKARMVNSFVYELINP